MYAQKQKEAPSLSNPIQDINSHSGIAVFHFRDLLEIEYENIF